MKQNRELTMMEALTVEAAQILQDMSAVISRQAHLVEQLALLRREEPPQVAQQPPRGGYTGPATMLFGERPSERGIPLDQVAALRDSLRCEPRPTEIDRDVGNCENQQSQANATAEAEGTITAQPPEAEVVSRVAPGRTGDVATEAGADSSEASDAGSQADEAAGGVTVGGDESGTAVPQEEPITPEPEPAPPKTRKEIVLDRFAETGDDNQDLAKFSSSAIGSVEIYLSHARKSGDPRAAQGDLKRIRRREEPTRQALAAAARSQESLRARQTAQPSPPPSPAGAPPANSAAYKAATQPKTVQPHEDDIGKPLCRVDTSAQIVDGPDDEVPLRGPWLRVVGFMADQRRATVEELMPMSGASDRRAFDDAMKRANLALAKTGLTIHDCDGVGLFQLRKLI